jgi:pimeloyl-ACP methyl ester carboxylesterase
LDVAALARANAQDILRVQPQGPYLLGGHSYGGCVAMEVAMLLEAWGHDVGLVLVGGAPAAAGRRPSLSATEPAGLGRDCPRTLLSLMQAQAARRRPTLGSFLPPPAQIMDTPRPEQVRAMQPGAQECAEEDALELVEMILGALGRDAIGLGASSLHPRESEEWRNMSMAVGGCAGAGLAWHPAGLRWWAGSLASNTTPPNTTAAPTHPAGEVRVLCAHLARHARRQHVRRRGKPWLVAARLPSRSGLAALWAGPCERRRCSELLWRAPP